MFFFYLSCSICGSWRTENAGQKPLRQWAFSQGQEGWPTSCSWTLPGVVNCPFELFGILEAGFNQVRTWCIVERSWTTRKMLLGLSIMRFPHSQWKCGTIQTSGPSFWPHIACPVCCCSRLRNTRLYSKVTAKYCQSLLRNFWSYNFSDRFVQQRFNRCQIHVK